MDVDALLRNAWENVYLGNSQNLAATICNYLHKYKSYLFISSAESLDVLCAQDLFDTIQDADRTAPGMDYWAYADWQLLPVDAFTTPAHILNLVEGGSPWPDAALHAKTWGKTRLRHLRPWVEKWRLPQMYGGMPGVGAEDA
eukprot:378708-Karenia_brevis.AAC.1